MKKETKSGNMQKAMEEVTKRLTVKIDGKEYPCYFTMGIALTFKNITGRDTTEMSNGLSDFAVYLYACSQSACRREIKEFPFEDVRDFADHIDGEELARLSELFLTDDEEKKRSRF